MKKAQEISLALRRLVERGQTPGLSQDQKTALSGAISALAWAVGFPANAIDQLLSDEPMAVGRSVADLTDDERSECYPFS